MDSTFPGEAATVYYNYDGLGKRRLKTLDLTNWTWWRWDAAWNVVSEHQEGTNPNSEWDIGARTRSFGKRPVKGVSHWQVGVGRRGGSG